MKIRSVAAAVLTRDAKPGSHPDYATVVVTLDDGRELTIEICQSPRYADTITMEVVADLVDDDPSLRINLNDQLIHDSTVHEFDLPSPRSPDCDNTGLPDDRAEPHVTVTVGAGSSRETTLALPVEDLAFIDVNGVTVAGIDLAAATIGTWTDTDQEEWVRAIEIGAALGVPTGRGMGFPDPWS